MLRRLPEVRQVSSGRRPVTYTRASLASAFALLILAGLAAAYMVARAGAADQLVAHTLRVREEAGRLFSKVRDAESGQRGFLLTGDPGYLEPFSEARASIPASLTDLRRLTADNPLQRQRLNALTPTVDAKLAELESTVALARAGRREEAIATVTSGRGRRLMDSIRAQLDVFSGTEIQLLAQREAAARSTRDVLLAVICLSLVTAIVLVGVLARDGLRLVRQLQGRTQELEAEVKLRHEAEDALRQAQKLESIGQLAGGIAHDFNNLLTIILGNLDTLRRRLAGPLPETAEALAAGLGKPLEYATQGGRSAAQLTQRLLAFARRQALAAAPLDLNRLVSGMSDLIVRTLGETIGVETILAGGLWPTLADANQVENALLNLCINARHAMPEGGKLTIETANTYLDEAYARQFGDVAPGQYVLLSVTDTGVGIAPEILDRVFEPFFTTNSGGDGSGLGLAMVHGFVKQSGGHVRIYSEPGQGTTVKIYLPRLAQAAVASAPAPKAPDESAVPPARPGEAILVVEDNAEVRAYVRSILEEVGYAVLEAGDAQEAMGRLRSGARIDLLFTDVVLPGANGRELSEQAVAARPGLPVLFTTGYTRNAIIHHGRLDAGVELLGKPYTQRALAQRVRAMLDRAGATSPLP